ncbi:LysR family transcriptional regulator [Hydrogenophaga sp. A37]|uniref:LysR family transcriptional regulator n=1 Tax=Hydrogenophaga sp. A37 TaxID=1945864 RepID=UPI0009846012|nr:LysR family transcriptional regulator [Hydrogenophaga sp. A37]OOG85880.1 LysR family transcriptional regulator [Hydrogenophaga sp. A37]
MDKLAFDDLKLFARVAALGSLSAVARERDVPVSQVSRALTRIEKTCGARLVHRSTHGLSLSAEGDTLLAYSHRITGVLDELEGEFAHQTGEARGLVRIACSTVIAQYFVVPSLGELNQRHPNLRVDLEVSDQLVDMAREGIDMAIRTHTALPNTQVARALGHLDRALYAAPAYAKQAGLPQHPDDLRHHRLIVNTTAPHLNQWPFVVEGHAVLRPAEGYWRINDTGQAANMVLQGLGIGRLATLAAAPLVRQGLLLPVLPAFVPHLPVPLYAITASARQRLPKIRACIDFWVEWIAKQNPPSGTSP